MIHGGGLAAWSVKHLIGVSMIAMAVVVLGLFALSRLGVDLLPHLIYPEIRARIVDPGVPAAIMEDRVTRYLEEQLAITEDAIAVQSRTREGRSDVDLTFSYGKDIDVALRDASTRLDRAKRLFPSSIDPPVIYKRDPSQIPILEFAVSSRLLDATELRAWIDYVFANWFLNLPGVASVEVGGAPNREILVQPDQRRMAGQGLRLDDLIDALRSNNVDVPGGALRMNRREIGSRTTGRLGSVEEIADLPISVGRSNAQNERTLRLADVADVIDSLSEEKLRIRLNRVPALKVAVQKQPQANTVAVVDAVQSQLSTLERQGLIPEDVAVEVVSDQSIYIRQALSNATDAAINGAVLAMIVVFLFLGDVRRTLIVGSGIPIAIMVALILMASFGLTLNIMTLGGIALGVGMLVDNTIVMLENIYRHQRLGEGHQTAAREAAAEVNSAIVASTSTNLAAVLPFLFIGGLVGLLFRELVATISAAIIASLLVSITLVPALASRIPVGSGSSLRTGVDRVIGLLQRGYGFLLKHLLRARWLVLAAFLAALYWSIPGFQSDKSVFLPNADTGTVRMFVVADSGVSLGEMDEIVARLEAIILARSDVESVFAQIGGFVFGRSESQRSNRSSLHVQLVPRDSRELGSDGWIDEMRAEIRKLQLVGVRVYLRTAGIRGIRIGRGDDDISLRVQGGSLETLATLGDQIAAQLKSVEGLRNVSHSAEDVVQELSVVLDRERAAAYGISVDEVGRAVRTALQGVVVTDFIAGDRNYDVRLRLPREEIQSPRDVETIVLFPALDDNASIHLGDVAKVDLITAPADIRRDRQQRIVEISASLATGSTLGEVMPRVQRSLASITLPDGYTLYDESGSATLKEGERLAYVLLSIAIFLVLVVMAVQYESLRNPLIILFSIPFAAIGVSLGIQVTGMAISMTLWLGMIMLAGIVVNNAIVLVEYIELERARGLERTDAIIEAGKLRLRPILMTTLTTVVGMTPLAIGLGEGSELLQPLARTIVWGLSFSLLVTLILVPAVYRVVGRREVPAGTGGTDRKAQPDDPIPSSEL